MTPSEFKQIQKDLKMDNITMAINLGVNISSIGHWRAGRRNISAKMENAILLLVAFLESRRG